ncbi:MAG: branched-chain amino acid ABC transporter permease [Hyphomonadaceae bacterium]
MSQLAANVFYSFTLQSLLATAFFIWFRPTRYFHATHAMIAPLGAYAAIYLWGAETGWVALVSALAGATLTAAAMGVAVEALYARLGGGRDRPLVILVVSLAIYAIAQNVLAIAFGERIVRWPALADAQAVSTMGVELSVTQVVAAGVAIAAVVAIWCWWELSAAGRTARALSDNPELADIVGVDTRAISRAFAAISAGCAGLAGVLIVLDVGVTPSEGFNLLIPAITAVLLSGARSISGVVTGAALVATLQGTTAFLLGSKWEDFVVYALLAAILVARPLGLQSNATREA